MRMPLKPIALNETSYNVALLHQTLRTFGLQVSAEEVAENRAGPDTLEKVYTLQARLNVPADDSTLLDETTAVTIAEAPRRRGLTATSRSFILTGTVR